MTSLLLVFLFWLAAALLVAMAGAFVKIAAIVAVAFAYTRLCARCAGMPYALGVGIAWLVLTIAAELLMTAHLGRGWFGLLGSPERPLLRNIDLFVWIFAPALFARGEEA
jgi:hypothetical protein